MSLPEGGGAIRKMGKKFAAHPVTGTGSRAVHHRDTLMLPQCGSNPVRRVI
jgi:hypothetical protein